MIGISLITSSCSKEVKPSTSDNVFKKEGDVSIECEYIVLPAPDSSHTYLQGYDDPREQELDNYLYIITKALTKYSCTNSFSTAFSSMAFDRYLGDQDGETTYADEMEVQDLINLDNVFETILQAEFVAAGLDMNIALADFTWEGYSYVPTVWLANYTTADWEKPLYFGIGTDINYPDSIAEFIPVLSTENCPNLIELIVGKVDRDKVMALPEPINYNSECLENPLLIVQLGWDKAKKGSSTPLGDPEEYIGSEYDTIIPGQQTGSGCTRGTGYYYISGSLGGQRFDRSKRSEFRIERYTLPVGSSNISWWPYYSTKEYLADVHKKDKHKRHSFNFHIDQMDTHVPLNPSASSSPSCYAYAATYEYDWYAQNRNLTFDSYRGKTPKLKLRRKGDHEHYQLMYLKPNWCVETVYQYTIERGLGLIITH